MSHRCTSKTCEGVESKHITSVYTMSRNTRARPWEVFMLMYCPSCLTGAPNSFRQYLLKAVLRASITLGLRSLLNTLSVSSCTANTKALDILVVWKQRAVHDKYAEPATHVETAKEFKKIEFGCKVLPHVLRKDRGRHMQNCDVGENAWVASVHLYSTLCYHDIVFRLLSHQ